MSDTTITTNMGLVVPTVTEDPGPDWANNINADLGILDQHSHVAGQGVLITPAAININTDLPFNSNNATLLNSIRFNNLSMSIPGIAPNLGCAYEANNEFYFNDGVGNTVQLTKAGAINATSSGISSGTATASFVGSVLVVDANVNTPANVQGASFLFGNNVSGSNFLILEPPSAMASNYTVTLPPQNTSGGPVFLTYDTSNNIGLGISSANPFINTANIVTGAITQPLLAPRSTGTTVGIGGVAVSPSCGTFNTTTNSVVTNLSVTLITSGRPVQILLQPDSTSGQAFIQVLSNSGLAGDVLLRIEIIQSVAGTISDCILQTLDQNPSVATEMAIVVPPSCISFLDMTVNGVPGTYTYTIQTTPSADVGPATATFNKIVLVAYEI